MHDDDDILKNKEVYKQPIVAFGHVVIMKLFDRLKQWRFHLDD